MTFLILGHTGFIGKRIYERLGETFGSMKVKGFSLPDIDASDENSVQQIVPYLGPASTVVVCAGVKRQLGDTVETFHENLRMAENLCRIAHRCTVRQIVFLSSAAVYGEDIHNKNIKEDTAINPRTFYGIAKYASERLLWKALQNQGNSTLAILRPPLVYGSGDASKGYGPSSFLDKLLRDEEILLWGDGTELREFLYVEDLAGLVREIVIRNYSGVLNAASGKSYSFVAMINRLASIVGKKPRVSTRSRTKEKVDNVFSAEKLNKDFPDFAFTPLEKGLKEMFLDKKLLEVS